MEKRSQVGTVEILRLRVYTTEKGEYVVEPGIYPVFHDARTGRYSYLLEGRSSERIEPSFQPIGEGMFMVRPGGDKVSGPATTFPYGYWSEVEFADLLTDPSATEGDPQQRLRFVMTVSEAAR
jgi:hypothetical protein